MESLRSIKTAGGMAVNSRLILLHHWRVRLNNDIDQIIKAKKTIYIYAQEKKFI